MIVDCVGCGDPLLPDMEQCRCGAWNPFLVSPEDEAASDLDIDHGLFMNGVLGLILGLGSLATASSAGGFVAAGVCALLGAASMLAYHLVDTTELREAAKSALRFALGAVGVLFDSTRRRA